MRDYGDRCSFAVIGVAARIITFTATVPPGSTPSTGAAMNAVRRTAVQDPDVLTGLVSANVIIDVTPAAPRASDTFRDVKLTYDFTPMISDFIIGSVTLTANRRVAR